MQNPTPPPEPRNHIRKTGSVTSINSSFRLPNGFMKDTENSDAKTHRYTYTSLRDLLPSSSPPPPYVSLARKSSSWEELPFKNPLVKHTAWAFLMGARPTTPSQAARRGFFQRLQDQCGCIGWLNDVVLKPLRVKFLKKGGEFSSDGEYEDDD